MSDWEHAHRFIEDRAHLEEDIVRLGEDPGDAAWALASSAERRAQVRGAPEVDDDDIEVMALSWCWIRHIWPLPPKSSNDYVAYMNSIRPTLIGGASSQERDTQRRALGRFFTDDFLGLRREQIAGLLSRKQVFVEGGSFYLINTAILPPQLQLHPPFGGATKL